MDDWAVSRQPHLLDVFRVTESGQVQTAAWDENVDKPGEWRGWWNLPGPAFVPEQPVCAVSPGPDALQAFVIGSNGVVNAFVWDQHVEGAAWRGPFPIKGINISDAVTAVSRAPGLIDLFARGLDGQVYTAAWDQSFDPPGKWRGWWRISDFTGDPQPLKLPITQIHAGQLSAVSRTPHSLDVFLFRNGAVHHTAWDHHLAGAQWLSWQKVCDPEDPGGGSAAGRPSAVALSSDRIDVFSITPVIQGVSRKSVDGGQWKGWLVQDDAWANSQPVKAVRRGEGNIEVFMFGTVGDNQEDAVCHGSCSALQSPEGSDFQSWSPWEQVPGFFEGRTRLAAVSRKPHVVDIFGHGTDDKIFTNSWDSTSGIWSGWRTIRP